MVVYLISEVKDDVKYIEEVFKIDEKIIVLGCMIGSFVFFILLIDVFNNEVLGYLFKLS